MRFAQVAFLVTAAVPLSAQTTVRGVLYDSLRYAGIEGAVVTVVGDARMGTRTDARGMFALVGVDAGNHIIRFVHPRLDSLGLESIDVPVSIDDGVEEIEIFAATPSLYRALNLLCGESPESTNRVVVRVADRAGHAVAEAGVRLEWIETGFARSRSTRSTSSNRNVAATTDEQGMAVVCEVPSPGALVERGPQVVRISPLRVSASRGSRSAGPFSIEEAGPGVLVLSLVADDGKDPVTIAGRVAQADGQSVPGARVRIEELNVGTVTDSIGAFLLRGVPARSQDLVVSAIGYRPSRVIVSPDADAVFDVGVVHLDSLATALDTVRITATALPGSAARFDDRRRVLSGTFLDSADLSKMPRVTPSFLAGRVPRALILNPLGGPRTFVFRRPGLGGENICVPRLFVDGQDQGPLDVGQLEELLDRAKRIEVYRANFAPPEFTDFAGCGAVVVWTK
ncbi:MAG: carboxypeptidase regulatory-like domain-containing protein [Gemmatimonadaceae bacterium]|nr:carboxypeptidase regulatory-like domain-containing protein [Gemmatimonadaceae bacterium]MCW5826537.1 carboxypeptidase regulatory-like domain-containing protein [Gemmatimonadaceae bacterium]